MKIAFISYEYPPDTAFGGIGTYARQAAEMLAQRGNTVEVFAGSPYRDVTEEQNGVLVHRIVGDGRQTFRELVGKVFAERHTLVQFDVLEGPEYGAEAIEAIRLVPDIPFVIKLHTPSFLIQKVAFGKPSLANKIRITLGALRRGKLPKFDYDYNPHDDIERLCTLQADEIAGPCLAIGNELMEIWGLDSRKVSCVPYAYVPSEKYLNIPLDTCTKTVSFIGRLEIRKGILDLAQAIPQVLEKCSKVKFRFIGKPLPSPDSNLNMQEYLEKILHPYKDSIEFVEAVPLDEIPSILANTDICVFPSIWENFALVCMEAMAAGRGVVASNAGGMAEMLDQGRVGRLVPPRSPKKIAEALLELLENPTLRMQLGHAARQRVLEEYNVDRIGELQEASYRRAIERRKLEGTRSFV